MPLAWRAGSPALACRLLGTGVKYCLKIKMCRHGEGAACLGTFALQAVQAAVDILPCDTVLCCREFIHESAVRITNFGQSCLKHF